MAFQAEGIVPVNSKKSVRACHAGEWQLFRYRECEYMGSGYQEIRLRKGHGPDHTRPGRLS